KTSIARLMNTMLDARELIEAIMLDFGLEPRHDSSKPYLLRDLARFLVDQRNAGRLSLLVIDEAQNLSVTALEEVRMLSNLETEKSKLIQIVLVGQPNLRDLLARPELEQLRQRVTVSYHLQALDAAETAAYISHRLRRAAMGAPLEFPRDVTDLIHLHSQGVPRKINAIADAVLLFGYGEERRVIDIELTADVLEELESTGVLAGHLSSPATPAGPVAQATDGQRNLQAEVRETRLDEREKRIEEKERVLLEGYRRLRTQSVANPAAPQAAATPARTLVPVYAPAAARAPAHAPPPAPRRYTVHAVPPENLWMRLRRQFLGGVPDRPAVEE